MVVIRDIPFEYCKRCKHYKPPDGKELYIKPCEDFEPIEEREE
jgi:hypothetical protein